MCLLSFSYRGDDMSVMNFAVVLSELCVCLSVRSKCRTSLRSYVGVRKKQQQLLYLRFTGQLSSILCLLKLFYQSITHNAIRLLTGSAASGI